MSLKNKESFANYVVQTYINLNEDLQKALLHFADAVSKKDKKARKNSVRRIIKRNLNEFKINRKIVYKISPCRPCSVVSGSDADAQKLMRSFRAYS